MLIKINYRWIKSIFTLAKAQQPSVILIDEVEFLACDQSEHIMRRKTEFLVQMQNLLQERVTVLGVTNVPWKLDPALRRRFEKRIYVPLPDKNERQGLIKAMLPNQLNSVITEDDLIELSEMTEGLSIFFYLI